MTDTVVKTKKAFVVSNFRDAGSEASFTAGAIVDLPEGVFGNYEAAGLVREPTTEDKPEAAKPKPTA